jgi:hypothetical protein
VHRAVGEELAETGHGGPIMQTGTTSSDQNTTPNVQATGCCPPFEPSAWQDREITWIDEPFVVNHVRTLMHVPLDMGKRVTESQALIDAAGAAPEQPLMLCDETSNFSTELFIHVTRSVPGAQMTAWSGRFLTHVYEGPYRDAKRWAEDMAQRVSARGETLVRLYFAYTTCPACAKAYGKNYVIAFARVLDKPQSERPSL